jgi:DNA helicase HerA-like ATPase
MIQENTIATAPAPADRAENEHIGVLVALKGAHATLSGHMGPDGEQARCSVGDILVIKQGKARTVGLVLEVNVNPHDWIAGSANHVNMQIELIGEVRDDADGRPIFFRGVRSYPEMGSSASLIRISDLAAIYAMNDEDGVRVGSLSLREDIPAMVSVTKLVNRHFAIVGSTGVGKTTAVALLMKKCLEENKNLHMLILDPHNEYRTHFRDDAIILNSDNLDLPFWILRYEELADIIYPGRTPSPDEADALFEAMAFARIGYANQSKTNTMSSMSRRQQTSENTNITADTPLPYRISDIQKVIDDWLGLLERRYPINTLRALRTRLDSLAQDPRYRCMFGKTLVADNMVEVISNIFRIPQNGRPVTILELGGLPNEVINALVSVIGRLAFDISFMSRGAHQIALICEEGHRYVPRDHSLGFRPTRLALGRIAKEGRKYGVSLGVISQRPAEIDPTLLSQCSTIFAMRLPNETDKAIIKECLPAYSASLSDMLSSIVDREAIAFGEAVPTPMRMTFANHRAGPRHEQDAADAPAVRKPESIARIVARLRGEYHLA